MKKFLVQKEYLRNRGEGLETRALSDEVATYRTLEEAKQHIIDECDTLMTYKELNLLEEKELDVLSISFVLDGDYNQLDVYGVLK